MVTVRLLIVAVLVVAVVVGTGGVVAETDTPGRACPGDNPSKGFERSDEGSNGTSVVRSLHGRITALSHVGCI